MDDETRAHEDGAIWILFIYSLPSQPSRYRAYVWRELKKLGAIYLRDGVALLPRRERLEQHMQDIAARVHEYEGSGDVVLVPAFPASRERAIILRFQEERTSEYREVHHACVRFLRDVLEEVDREEFGFPDVGNLESELGRLRRWNEQIRERDYFDAPGSDRVVETLAKCETAFEHFASTASERETGERAQGTEEADDVFERLGGRASDTEAVKDLPI